MHLVGLAFEGLGYATGLEIIFFLAACLVAVICLAFNLRAIFKFAVVVLWLWVSVVPIWTLARDFKITPQDDAARFISMLIWWAIIQCVCAIWLFKSGAWRWPLSTE